MSSLTRSLAVREQLRSDPASPIEPYDRDLLTGLPGPAALLRRLERALARVPLAGAVVLLAIDLDARKPVSDGLGPVAADDLVRQAACRLDAVRRPDDMLAHRGGDEFLLLVELADGDSGAATTTIAGRIIMALATPFDVGGTELRITAAVGAAIARGASREADELVRLADAARYEAIEGGGGFELGHGGTAKPLTRMSVGAALQRAVENDELILHYQPIYRLPQRELIGLEALVRWERDGKLVPPDEFINIAERTGVIHALGNWVLETLCRQARLWESHGLRPHLGINVSPRQLRQPELATTFADTVARWGLEPSRLIVELTESGWTIDSERTRASLTALAKAGFVLALDDFGAGYSSLGRLRSLPADVIKIDRSFMPDLPHNPEAVAIVEAILALARGCGCDIVCEGVETEAQLEYLSSRGASLAQGFGLGRPAPASDITRLLISELSSERRADRPPDRAGFASADRVAL